MSPLSGSVIDDRLNGDKQKKFEHKNIWAPMQVKTCLQWFANGKGADQPVHPHSLISSFVIRFWKVAYQNLQQVKFHYSI